MAGSFQHENLQVKAQSQSDRQKLVVARERERELAELALELLCNPQAL